MSDHAIYDKKDITQKSSFNNNNFSKCDVTPEKGKDEAPAEADTQEKLELDQHLKRNFEFKQEDQTAIFLKSERNTGGFHSALQNLRKK